MFSWSSLFTLIGIVGSCLSIYEFIRLRLSQRPGTRPQHIAMFCAIVFLVMLVGSILFAPILAPAEEYGKIMTPTPTTNPSVQGTGSTPTPTLTPSPTPTPVPPTPTPTPVPPTPTPHGILYQADSSWSGWNGTKDWKVNSGLLLNDGTYADYNANPTIVAPYQPPTANYAVDIQMQVVNAFTTGTIYPCFYIAIRGTMLSNGWQGYVAVICANQGHGPAVQIAAVDSSNNVFDVLSTAPFDAQNAWHTYHVEASGTTIRFFVDGGQLLSADDSRYLNAGQIGLWSNYMQVKLSSFKITAL